MASDTRNRLLQLYKERAVSFGRFTLASGKESAYYIDSKKAIFNSEILSLLAEELWDKTKDLEIHAMGGLEIGAIPMACAAAVRFHAGGRQLESFFVRKQVKDHGSKQRVEGRVKPGDRVAIVDDVLTTGGSVLQAIEEVEKLGAKVVAVICIVDRLEGAREKLTPKYNFMPLYSIRDLGIEPKSTASNV